MKLKLKYKKENCEIKGRTNFFLLFKYRVGIILRADWPYWVDKSESHELPQMGRCLNQ